MVPTPVALGLNVCEKIVVEEGTKNVTLVNCFSKMFVDSFPSDPQRFALYAVLRDGQGLATIQLVVTDAESDEEIYSAKETQKHAGRPLRPVMLFTDSSHSGALYQLHGLPAYLLRPIPRQRHLDSSTEPPP